MEKEKKIVYEIRLGGKTMCQSNQPMLGYSKERLRRIVAAGYRYYVDGKLQRRIGE